jgi:hypothetical protein
MHHSVTRNELLNIILHVLLEVHREITQVYVAFFVVPCNDFCRRALFSMIADPRCNPIVDCACGDKRPKVVIVDLCKFQPALIERAVGVVIPFPADKCPWTFG